MPVIVQPDVEGWATSYLRAALAAQPDPYAAGVYVSNTVPSTRRDRMVIVRRDGGLRLDLLREVARLAVRVWATTDADVADLASLVAALLWDAPTGEPVLRVAQPTGATPVADPSGQPLRYMTFEVTVRGTQR